MARLRAHHESRYHLIRITAAQKKNRFFLIPRSKIIAREPSPSTAANISTMTSVTFTPPALPRSHKHHPPRRRILLCQRQPNQPTPASTTPLTGPSPTPTPTSIPSTPTFKDLTPPLPAGLLNRLNRYYTHPTKTQQLALPYLLTQHDVLLHAPTGTGKTLCYLITILANITPTRSSAQAIILVPTPELGQQVVHTFRQLSDLPYASVYSADRADRMALRTGPRVVLGTPVAIWAMASVLRLDLVRVLVADEFDACLASPESVFALESILSVRSREDRQTVLCSATVPQHRHFLRRAMREAWLKRDVKYVTAGETVIPEGLRHAYVLCESGRKMEALSAVVKKFKGQVMVFVAERRDVDEVVQVLEACVEGGVAGIRKEWSAGERRHVMRKFRDKEVRTLVATDVAARGIDVPEIVGVVQVDLPRDADAYLHRAGRAGRMGRRGWSVLVIEEGEGFVVDRFANFLGVEFEQLGKRT